jgi:hypothetical protein
VITNQQRQAILDNPNLQASVLARFLAINPSTVRKVRGGRGIHAFRGFGIPYMTSELYNHGFRYVTVFRGRKLGVGSFKYCIEQLDRLLFCLEHNNGELPLTLEEKIFLDLKFIRKRALCK